MTSSTALIPAIPTFLAPPAGYTLKYRSSSLTYAPPFDIYNSTYNPANNALTNLFHNYGAIPDYNTPQHYQLGELSGLDDFRTESPYVRSNMAAIYNFWIQQAGFDGFRIDTFKHVEYWLLAILVSARTPIRRDEQREAELFHVRRSV